MYDFCDQKVHKFFLSNIEKSVLVTIDTTCKTFLAMYEIFYELEMISLTFIVRKVLEKKQIYIIQFVSIEKILRTFKYILNASQYNEFDATIEILSIVVNNKFSPCIY